MILSIDESIQHLRAEILSPDWRLSPRRIESIEAAFECLKNRFKTRKGMLSILAMAISVVHYIKKRDNTPPGVIDFLKETMAHIVSLYEERDYNPDHEEEIFQRILKKYNALKQKLQAEAERSAATATDHAKPDTAKPEPATPAPAPSAAKPAKPSPAPQAQPTAPATQQTTTATSSTDRLLHSLRQILGRRDDSAKILQQFLVGAVESAATDSPLTISKLQNLLNQLSKQLAPAEDILGVPDQPPTTDNAPRQLKKHEPMACEEEPVRKLIVGTTKMLVAEKYISMVRPLKPGKRTKYLRSGRINLSDFSGFMKGLASQFTGPLSEIKDRKLKKFALPVMAPRGLSLPEYPDENAKKIMVLSHRNWHGALFCAEIEDEVCIINKFCVGKNGDIQGSAWPEDGKPLPLLDVEKLLNREGFLSIVEG